ncbi:TetR/AcrR family transcriptional regulator [Nocardioides sp. LML1-1-1.1]|uniref:TetR/AcrR family transcriptional regulator n=1 Tax=Nocardioides sp. LML1-1-1.1 TaxID=3135248 RepID=UPI003422ADF1
MTRSTADLRVRLLRAAEQEIGSAGPAKASLRAIARRVGVSHQATAHHFEDRAGLFTALAVEGFELLLEEIAAAIDAVPDDADAGARVVASGAAYVEFALGHPVMFDVMFRPELLHADHPRLREARGMHLELMVGTVAAAQEAGWGTAVPTEELAVVGWASVHGLAVLHRDAQLADVLPEVDAAQLLRQVARALDALA